MKNLLLGILLAVSSMVYSQETELFTTYGDVLNGKEEFTVITIYKNSDDSSKWELLTKKHATVFHNIMLPCNEMHLISFVNGDEEKFLYIKNYKEGAYPITIDFNYKDIDAVIFRNELGYTHVSGTEEELFGATVSM